MSRRDPSEPRRPAGTPTRLPGHPRSAWSARGFSLIELMIAATVSLLIVAGAFVATNQSQARASSQTRATELVSQARSALEQIGRDIRSAGDAVQFLPEHCLVNAQSAGAPFGCPAILEPHPWRITLTRYAWSPGPDGIDGSADDSLPDGLFADDPRNVVTYQFVPRGERRDFGGGHEGWIGRLERISNPLGFAGQEPTVEVLLDDVLVDNRMRQSPDGNDFDHRRDHAAFLYQLLSVQSGEYEGDPAFTQRVTREGSFLLPPVRFFAFPADPAAWSDEFKTEPPFLSTSWEQQIVGLRQTTATVAELRAGQPFDADLRRILDFNRIRAVHVAFKIVDSREDPSFSGGIELDPERAGTARTILMESTFELKSFASYLR